MTQLNIRRFFCALLIAVAGVAHAGGTAIVQDSKRGDLGKPIKVSGYERGGTAIA